MNRPIVQWGVWIAAVAMVIASATPAWSQATSTAPSPAADESADTPAPPPPPPQCRFDELLRVELRDRKLDITLTPPNALAADLERGRSGTVLVVDSEPLEWRVRGSHRVQAEAEAEAPAEAEAAAEAAAEAEAADAGGNGRAYARFVVVPPPDHFPDRWSPLQLTSVESSDEALMINGSGRVGRSHVTVVYRQDHKLNAARLTVQRSRRGGFGRPLHDFTGADLLQLWNEHQREARQYLAPLLNTISPRSNVLRPRAGDVYRAFDTIPADAETTRRVAAILPELEAASPAAREAASAKLEALGPPAVLAVLRMDRAEWTPEQTARLAAFVQRHSTLADPLAWRRDIYFLTDCLDDPDPGVRQAALGAVRAVAGRPVEFDVGAAPEARLAAAQEILRTLESGSTNGSGGGR